MTAVRSRSWVAVAWAPYSRRSEMFARELGAPLHCIHYLKFRSPPYAPFKYVLQSVKTLRVLFTERPQAVHVQNPPFVCGLVVALYCRLSRARFVVEYHTAAFGRAWRFALAAQKLVAREAAANIVTDEHWARLVRSWGGHSIVMYDAFLDLPPGRPYEVSGRCTVAFLGTFAPDEPIEEFLEAAALLPDVTFYVTGDTGQAAKATLASARERHVHRVPGSQRRVPRFAPCRRCSRGAHHATTPAAGRVRSDRRRQPLVTSDFEYLRGCSRREPCSSPNVWSIRDGIVEAIDRRDELARESVELRANRRAEWKARLQELDEVVFPGSRALREVMQ
jgi:hypothetical protein